MGVQVRQRSGVTGFELLRNGHPVAAALEPLLDRVAADPLLRGDGLPGGARPAIRRELCAGADADGALAAPDTVVLRYIPLRRITFGTGDVVGKMKRPSSLAGAYARLAV